MIPNRVSGRKLHKEADAGCGAQTAAEVPGKTEQSEAREGNSVSKGRKIRELRTHSESWSVEQHARKAIDEVGKVDWLAREGFEHEAMDAGLFPHHW